MNSVARSLALRGLHRREVRDRLHRPAEASAASFGNKNKPPAAAAGYSTAADRLAAYLQYKADGGGYLPLVAVVVGTWLIVSTATRCFMTGTTSMTTTVVEGPNPKVAAASPSFNWPDYY